MPSARGHSPQVHPGDGEVSARARPRIGRGDTPAPSPLPVSQTSLPPEPVEGYQCPPVFDTHGVTLFLPAPLSLLLAVFLPAFGAGMLAVWGSRLGRRASAAALVFPVLSTLLLLSIAGRIQPRQRLAFEWPWMPSLGLNLDFLVDGLALFFGLVVSGMGVLIFYYARQYLGAEAPNQGRFYASLLLFMSAMLGTVFANHLLLLFVFWELTSIASFLLIGFSHGEESSRRGARMAFLVTGATGLALLTGAILLGQLAGTYRLDTLLATASQFTGAPELDAAFLLIALGAFGKSAQFPLHFWLPNAMAAPTPISAYLHSATMVKLGVFLLARVLPLFQASEWWLPLLAIVGFGTMLLGAALALLSHDLKAILAYSTISQLGYLVGGYGVAPASGIDYDYLHILNHVFYKGSLFMIVGIIDHATGTRDLRVLGGLGRRMPVLGVLTLVACATMAGLVGTTGFLSKEVMFAEIFALFPGHGGLGLYAIAAVVLTSLLKAAFSARIYFGVFRGAEPAGMGEHFHAPGRAFLAPPLVLVAGAVLFGIAPGLLEGPLDFLAIDGLHSAKATDLALWHGITRELLASLGVIVAGLVVYRLGASSGWRWAALPRCLRFDLAFEHAVEGVGVCAKLVTRATGADSPNTYLRVMLAFVVVAMGGFLFSAIARPDWSWLWTKAVRDHSWNELRHLVAITIAVATLGVVLSRRWTAQLVSLSIAGFLTCFYFVLYRAPDLALTQILVETISLILVLYLLGRFPKSAQQGEEEERRHPRRRWLPLLLATSMGTLMTALALLMTAERPTAPLGGFFLRQTLPLAGGANAVNTLLVDFRGFDTLGEVTVLVVAMLGILGLLMRLRRTPEDFRLGPLGPPGYGIDPRPADPRRSPPPEPPVNAPSRPDGVERKRPEGEWR